MATAVVIRHLLNNVYTSVYCFNCKRKTVQPIECFTFDTITLWHFYPYWFRRMVVSDIVSILIVTTLHG